MDDMEYIDDAEEIILEKRHDEVLRKFDRLITAISTTEKKDDDTKIIQAINDQSKLIKDLLQAYKENEAKEIKVEVRENSGEKLVTSFEEVVKGVLDKLEALKNEISTPKKQIEWVHKITEREFNGRPKIIVSTPKI